MKSKFSYLDAALVALILGSAGILFYVLSPTSEKSVESTPPKDQHPGLMTEVKTTRFGAKDKMSLFSQINHVSDQDWKTLSNSIGKYEKDQVACFYSDALSSWGLVTLDSNLADRLRQGSVNVLFGFRVPSCIRQGSEVNIVRIGKNPDDLMVEYLNTAKVETLVYVPTEKLPDTFFELINFPKARFPLALPTSNNREPANLILRLSNFQPKTIDQKKHPPVLPRGDVIKKSSLEQYLKGLKAYTLVDLRSARRFSKGTIKNAINEPFSQSEQIPKFSWKSKVEDIQYKNWNPERFYPLKDAPIILFGENSDDPTPAFVARELFNLGVREIVWIYDGFQGK